MGRPRRLRIICANSLLGKVIIFSSQLDLYENLPRIYPAPMARATLGRAPYFGLPFRNPISEK